jgi:DNA (cytosine-5)-methyltransferase 1
MVAPVRSPDLPIPVIDLFAGPGGLGEGISALGRSDGASRFTIRLSVEKDPIAHQTLELRAFFRQFPHHEAPKEYYQHLQGRLSRSELFSFYEREGIRARQEAWLAELGKVDAAEIRQRITNAVAGAEEWVLIGGPPCQAYSVVGRSRNIGRKDRQFLAERRTRQTLYVEYLQVIADHRPAVFVMENVKGLLSATVKDERILQRILEDLHYPSDALKRERRTVATPLRDRYRIYSLEQCARLGASEAADFVVRAERHGVPQARHRVIILGVRGDLPETGPDVLPHLDSVPARDVFMGLPRLRSGLSAGRDAPEAWRETLHQGGWAPRRA